MRAAVGLNLKAVWFIEQALVLVSVTVYMRGPTASPSSSGSCQLTVAEKGPKSLTVRACGTPGELHITEMFTGHLNHIIT